MKKILVLCLFLNSLLLSDDKFNELVKYNEYISTLYKEAGSGLKNGKYNLEFDKLIGYPNGSCYQLGYLLARKAKELGFNAQLVGLFSLDGRNDLMVNVKKSDANIYLFVPSAGAYYNYSVWQILDNPRLSNQFISISNDNDIVNKSRIGYLNESFFKTINKIELNRFDNNYDTTKNIEFNLLKKFKKVISENLYDKPYNEVHLLDDSNTYYTAGKENNTQQSIKYIFEQSIEVYRFYFLWYSNSDYAKKINIIINDEKVLEFENNSSGVETEITLPKSIKDIKSIKFIFSDFNGQNRLLIKKIGAY